MSVLRGGILTVSIATALGLLALLLLLATAPNATLLQQSQTRAAHIGKVVESLEQFVLSRAPIEQKSNWAGEYSSLKDVLRRTTSDLLASIESAYAAPDIFAEIRKTGITAINLGDVDLPKEVDPEGVHTGVSKLSIEMDRISVLLDSFQNERAEFVDRLVRFELISNDLLSQLRQRGENESADTVYVAGNRIAELVTTSSSAELNDIFVFIGELEAIESNLPQDQQEPLRRLVNTAYVLNGLKRTMNQAVEDMNLSMLASSIRVIEDRLDKDRNFAAVAISDARILLNVSTILLLTLLALLGRRLQSSYAELNLSHEELEKRIDIRTGELRQANDDLKESQVQLVQAEKMSSLGQLVAGVMHEINTPLLYVQNNTTMTATSVQELKEFLQLTLPLLKASNASEVAAAIKALHRQKDQFDPNELLENIEEVASLATDSLDGLHQISELVQSLKDFSRLDRIADDKFDVRDGIEKTLVITRNMLKQGVEVIQDLEEVPEIYCSPSRLNQVFINLVTNATQAMDGRGKLKISTRWLQGEAGESVEVTFEDTGCGIPEEHLNKILDPFFTTKPVGQGTGLGLSIVHQIMEQHSGQIFIDSKVGVGTRIVLNFPLQPEDKSREEAA